ncbi:MAG: hypothetical protein AABY28_06150 [Candidatus Omnitrophota bacterium]
MQKIIGVKKSALSEKHGRFIDIFYLDNTQFSSILKFLNKE